MNFNYLIGLNHLLPRGYIYEKDAEEAIASQNEAGNDGEDDFGTAGNQTALTTSSASSILNCFGLLVTPPPSTTSAIKATGALDSVVESQFDMYATSKSSMLLKVM